MARPDHLQLHALPGDVRLLKSAERPLHSGHYLMTSPTAARRNASTAATSPQGDPCVPRL